MKIKFSQTLNENLTTDGETRGEFLLNLQLKYL